MGPPLCMPAARLGAYGTSRASLVTRPGHPNDGERPLTRKLVIPALIALVLLAVAASALALPQLQHPQALAERVLTATHKPVAVVPPKLVVWPLLGTPAPSVSAIQRRVVVVKIDNENGAHPESRMSDADVVFETPTEGGESRYAAIYHSRMPGGVGPVRSGRLSDVYIVTQFRALFARCGGDYVCETAFKRAALPDLNQFWTAAPYFRSSVHSSPHNLYVNLPALQRAGASRGFPAVTAPPQLEFGALPSVASAGGTSLGAAFSPIERFSWAWLPKAGQYVRARNGSREADAGNRTPYEASNVVVMFAKAAYGYALDPAGNRTLDVVIQGSGRAVLFRDGRRFEGVWITRKGQPPVLQTAKGAPLPLAPGRTWFEVLPNGTALSAR